MIQYFIVVLGVRGYDRGIFSSSPLARLTPNAIYHTYYHPLHPTITLHHNRLIFPLIKYIMFEITS